MAKKAAKTENHIRTPYEIIVTWEVGDGAWIQLEIVGDRGGYQYVVCAGPDFQIQVSEETALAIIANKAGVEVMR